MATTLINESLLTWRINPYTGLPTWTYGNYGGGGWTGGEFTPPGQEPKFAPPPKDTLDGVFKVHDGDYGKAIEAWDKSAKTDADKVTYWNAIIQADTQMRQSIADLKLNNGWGDVVPGKDVPNFDMANAALQADSVDASSKLSQVSR